MALAQRPAAPMRGLARLLCGAVVWALLSTEVLAAKPADAVSEQPPAASEASRALDDKAAAAPKAAEPEKAQQEGEAAQDAADDAAAKAAEPEKAQQEGEAADDAAAKAAQMEKSDKAAEGQNGILAELTHVKAELAKAKAEIARTSGVEQDRAKQDDENKKLKENVASQEKAVAELSSKVAQSNKLLAETKTELETTKQDQIKERTVHEAQNQGLTDEVAAKKVSVVELKSRLELQTTAGEKTQAELVSTQADLTSTQKELAAANAKIEVTLDAAKAQQKEQTARYKELEDSAEVAETQAQAQAESQKAKAEALKEEHERLHGHHKILEEMYADPSVQHFLNAKAYKVYKNPGIEGAANKTFVYVLPTLEKRYASGREFLNASQLAVYSKLNAFVGYDKVDPWLPAISGSLVYGGIIFPFICAVCCLTRIVCKLKPLLLFCHLDFLLTTLCAGIFALYTGKEPLAVFAHHDASVYLFTQVIFAAAFCLYFVLLFCAYCLASSKAEGCYRIMQIAGAFPIMTIYFVYVWTPAMQDQMPKMDELVKWVVGDGVAVSNYAWVPYLPVAFLFAVLLRLERLSWHASGSASTKATENQISVVMRSDVEMATIYGEKSLPAQPKGE